MTQQTASDVLNTIGYGGFVKALYNRSGDISKDFTHAVLGIVTESHEYALAADRVNAVEEAGDIIFYLTALQQVLNDVSPIDGNGYDALVTEASIRVQSDDFRVEDAFDEWLDLAKRWIGYGKAPKMSSTSLLAEASVLVGLVVGLGGAADVEARVIVEANVEKLLKRYNGLQFDADRAVNRDTDAERAALERHAS